MKNDLLARLVLGVLDALEPGDPVVIIGIKAGGNGIHVDVERGANEASIPDHTLKDVNDE